MDWLIYLIFSLRVGSYSRVNRNYFREPSLPNVGAFDSILASWLLMDNNVVVVKCFYRTKAYVVFILRLNTFMIEMLDHLERHGIQTFLRFDFYESHGLFLIWFVLFRSYTNIFHLFAILTHQFNTLRHIEFIICILSTLKYNQIYSQ